MDIADAVVSYKALFSRSLAAHEAQDRLHFAAHSHHLWPDAARVGQMQCWDDGARLADRKWDKVMGEVWPAAQREIAKELRLPSPETIVFATNTHDLLIRLLSARKKRPIRVLASDGEFHSFSRQAARWVESGRIILETIPLAAFESFDERFLSAAENGHPDLIFTSQVFFGSGHVFRSIEALANLTNPDGCWVVMDGYHGFMAVETDLSAVADRIFYLAGGYKYAMAGEGMGFMHCPPGYGPRPEITGWYAAFDDLAGGADAIGYAPDARRFLGATFDPSALYRFLAVRTMLREQKLDTGTIGTHVQKLQQRLLERLPAALADAQLLNPLTSSPHARFLAFRTKQAQSLTAALARAGVTTDARGDILRIGIGLYHDMGDVERLIGRLENIESF